MKMFDYSKLIHRTWDNEIVSYIAQIHEFKGRQELYIRQKPVELERLIEIAKIQSTEASNRIEGIVTTNARLKQLVENKTTANEIAKTLTDGTKEVLFTPLEPYETPAAITSLCESYQKAIDEGIIDPLILIPCFVLDFLCIHPFNDGNGRMSRLLTLLLLYKCGYVVGQFISIEKAIAATKESYYDSLALSDLGWHENENDPKEFIKYMLGVILSCYREFEDRVGFAWKSGVKSTSYDIVKQYTQSKIGTFTKQDALIACPSLGSSSVEAALKKLVNDGSIERLGSGRKTHYVRRDS